MVGNVSDPATAHANAWKAVGDGIVSTLLGATMTGVPTSYDSGGTSLAPVKAGCITTDGLKAAIKTAIAGTSGVTPANAHVKYWDSVGGASVDYLATNLKLELAVATSSPVSHSYTPTFNGKTGDDLREKITDAIAAADKSDPNTIHENMWKAASGAIVKFIEDNYKASISPAAGAGGTTLTISVS